MEIALSSLAFLVAALCAGTMGFAIRRGATRTVAVDEVVSKRCFNRLTALLEASTRGRRQACARRDIPTVGANAFGLPANKSVPMV